MDQEGSRSTTNHLVLSTFRLNGCLIEFGNQLVSDIGLTAATWQVLSALDLSPLPLPVSHIARNMGLARQSVQRSVDCLAAKGLVSFDKNPHHQRSKLALLTDAGREAIVIVTSRIKPIDDCLQEMIGADRMALASSVLNEMREGLMAMQDHPGQIGEREEAA